MIPFNVLKLLDTEIKNCEIQFYKDDQPKRNYDVIGKIESHI